MERVYGNYWLRSWLERDSVDVDSSTICIEDMMFVAAIYDVMLFKMMRTVPEVERYGTLRCGYGRTVLHCTTAISGNTIHDIVGLIPEAHRFEALSMRDKLGMTVLHWATHSSNPESIKTIFTLLPESQRLQAVCMQDRNGDTILHLAANSQNYETITVVLSVLQEPQRLQAVNVLDRRGDNVLRMTSGAIRDSIMALLQQSGAPDIGQIRFDNTALLTR